MKPKTLITISMITAIALLLSACSTGDAALLTASGTFSANETNVASELSGKVVEVGVDEGAEIEQGQMLFKIDDEIYRAQYEQATAAVKAAEAAVEVANKQAASAGAQYQLALQAALMQDIPSRQSSWAAATPDKYRPAWYFEKAELIAAAEVGVSNAEEALSVALNDLVNEQTRASSQDFIAVENRLAVAQNELTVAQSTYDQVKAGGDTDLKDAASIILKAAQAEFDSALAEYQRLITGNTANAILDARSRVVVAQSNLDNARNKLLSLQSGEQSLQVVAAQAASEAAASGVEQAEAMLEQALKAENLTKLQLERTTVKAPIGGVVMTRSIEVGDLAVAGGTVLRIAQLDTLNLVVYLPEDQYGKVNIGDKVSIDVDSYPDDTFSGTIIHISDEAEYTPKNVQTETGRKASVFAIKIQVNNLDHRLKPGMPADVEFSY